MAGRTCVLLLALAVAACEQRARPDSSAAPSSVTPVVDTWERSLACSNQAERLMKRLESQVEDDPFLRIWGWQNHYSPTFRRCFVRVTYYNGMARTEKTLPMNYAVLVDAVENRELATCASLMPGQDESHCGVHDGSVRPGDCVACDKFISERMSQ